MPRAGSVFRTVPTVTQAAGFSPQASGSGIPYVEAVLARKLTPASLMLLPVKFFCGLLAIGAGLMLGREGPSVQMGANIGALLGKKFRLEKTDLLTLMSGKSY